MSISDLNSLAEILGVATTATAEELRSAYLKKVQQHPPDRDPELFEQIRDAYDQLRNPSVRARAIVDGPSPDAPLTDLLTGLKPSRVYVGSQIWIDLLKEKRA